MLGSTAEKISDLRLFQGLQLVGFLIVGYLLVRVAAYLVAIIVEILRGTRVRPLNVVAI